MSQRGERTSLRGQSAGRQERKRRRGRGQSAGRQERKRRSVRGQSAVRQERKRRRVRGQSAGRVTTSTSITRLTRSIVDRRSCSRSVSECVQYCALDLMLCDCTCVCVLANVHVLYKVLQEFLVANLIITL